METENKRTVKEHPQYFGAYLNMARHNVFLINNHIAKKYGKNILQEEGEIENSIFTHLTQSKINDKSLVIYLSSSRFLQVLNIYNTDYYKTKKEIDDNGPTQEASIAIPLMEKQLKPVLNQLKLWRNDYSHCNFTEGGRSLTTNQNVIDFVNKAFEKAIEAAKIRFKDTLKEKDYELLANYKPSENQALTTNGFIFFICLFLEPEAAFQMLNGTIGFKNTGKPEFLAVRMVFTHFCVKLPHDKFESSNLLQSIDLQIVNELNTCPKVLYQHINEKAQGQFQPEISNIFNVYENSVPAVVEDYEEYAKSLSKRIRHSDRFNYFALRYFDLMKSFTKMRFHVNLGKLVVSQHPKVIAKQEIERLVVEQANGFFRLNEMVDEKNLNQKINQTQNEQLNWEQFAPHYHMPVNKIAVGFTDAYPKFIKDSRKTRLKNPQPDAFLSGNMLPQMLLLEILEPGKAEKIIQEFKNTFKQKILDEQFIDDIKKQLNFEPFNKKTNKKDAVSYKPEESDDIANRKKQLNALLEKHELNYTQIPSRLLNYWLKIQEPQKKHKFADYIKSLTKDCKQRAKDQAAGKAPKIGEMATFLAQDIVKMIIDEKTKAKVSSVYFNIIQECLALYENPDKKDTLLQIFRNDLRLFDPQIHPFLRKIQFDQLRYTSDIYYHYIKQKGTLLSATTDKKPKPIHWLRKTFYHEYKENGKFLTKVAYPQNDAEVPLSIKKKHENKSKFEDWLEYMKAGFTEKNHNNKPIPLEVPANLLDAALVSALKKALPQNNVVYNNKESWYRLFRLWWENVKGDGYQNWYQSTRKYTFKTAHSINFEPDSAATFEEYYNDTKINKILIDRHKTNPKLTFEQLKKNIKKKLSQTELEIKNQKDLDALLFLIFTKLGNENLEGKLYEIHKLLDKQVVVQEKFPEYLSFDENGMPYKKKADRKPIEIKIEETRKYKEFSVLKRYRNDRRLPELFAYFEVEWLSVQKLKEELECYNKYKNAVFDRVFDLEELLFKNHKDEIIDIQKEIDNGIKNISHTPYLKYLEKKGIIDEQTRRYLKIVRDTFSHNQFPPRALVLQFIPGLQNENIAEQIMDDYKKRIEDISEKIKQKNR